MTSGILERFGVRAMLSNGDQLVATQAAADAGDESWAQWLAEHARGEALLLSLRVTADYTRPDDHGQVALMNAGVWVENDPHPPAVEEQVRELVFKDVALLSAQLAEHGVKVTEEALARMYVRVELAPDVRAALGSGGGVRRTGPALGPGLESWVQA